MRPAHVRCSLVAPFISFAVWKTIGILLTYTALNCTDFELYIRPLNVRPSGLKALSLSLGGTDYKALIAVHVVVTHLTSEAFARFPISYCCPPVPSSPPSSACHYPNER